MPSAYRRSPSHVWCWSITGAAAVALLAAPAGAQLTLRVAKAPPLPAGLAIHVAGTFNGWNPAAPGSALTPQAGGGYAITLPDSVRGAIAYKFTLGAWATVETTASGADVPNRTTTVQPGTATTVVANVLGWRTPPTPAPTPGSTASPSVHVLSDSFPIPQLGRTRRVWLYLPPGYATSTRRYPVIYMQDGQNVFDAATAFAGEWGVDETLDSLHAAHAAPDAIVVAVDHGGSHRLDEYDPWHATDPKNGGGEGDAYVAFLAATLKPYVDAHYRTRPDARHTAIVGSSMGGLIALYAALRRPDVFGGAGVFSCACWVARPQLLAFVTTAAHDRPAPHLYFVVGARETADGEPARDQRAVIDTLAVHGFPATRAVRARVAADGQHAEWFWRREFAAAYEWLVGP